MSKKLKADLEKHPGLPVSMGAEVPLVEPLRTVLEKMEAGA